MVQVIVMTSDNYYHCLTPFMHLWRKFYTAYTSPEAWSDYDLVICGFSEPEIDLTQFDPWRFHSIGAYEDYPADKWTDAMLKVLDEVADDVFILLLEDFWLCRPADARGVQFLVNYARQFKNVLKIDLATDRLYMHAGATFACGANTYNHVGHLDLIKSPHGTPYQMSLWGGIWRRDVMRRFIIPGETAQQLELSGTPRVTEDVLVLGTRQAPLLHGNVYQSRHGKTPTYSDNGWAIPEAEVEFMRGKGWIE
jgi:hypothetical protein